MLIQSFERMRKKGREGHTVRFMEVSPEKKVSSMGTITLHPNEIKEPFKRRGAHTLIGCTHVFYYRGQERENTSRGKINYERRMLSEGLAEMTPVIDWHSPNEIVILSSENGSAENPPNPNTFAGKCAVLNKKSSRVRLHRKRIAPEAPNVRIMKGFRQPPNGQKIPKILIGSDFVAKSSPETVTSAAAAAVAAAANVGVASTNSAASRNDGVPTAAATTTTTTTSGAAASGAVLPELPAN